MSFLERQHSINWESVPLKLSPECSVLLFVKPPDFPEGLVFQIPDAVYQQLSQTNLLNLRHLLESAGFSPQEVICWNLFGAAEEDGMSGWNPAFEQIISPPSSGALPYIYVTFQKKASTTIEPVAPHPSTPSTSNIETVSKSTPAREGLPQEVKGDDKVPISSMSRENQIFFQSIKTDWASITKAKKGLEALRRQLVQTQSALSNLNRDLNSNEKLKASRNDIKEWNDARRWMRDLLTKISCGIRDHDIGMTSKAGQGDWYEQTYRSIVLEGQHTSNLQEITREFAMFRKQMSVLSNSLTAINSAAQRDGIQRANRILNLIRTRK